MRRNGGPERPLLYIHVYERLKAKAQPLNGKLPMAVARRIMARSVFGLTRDLMKEVFVEMETYQFIRNFDRETMILNDVEVDKSAYR